MKKLILTITITLLLLNACTYLPADLQKTKQAIKSPFETKQKLLAQDKKFQIRS